MVSQVAFINPLLAADFPAFIEQTTPLIYAFPIKSLKSEVFDFFNMTKFAPMVLSLSMVFYVSADADKYDVISIDYLLLIDWNLSPIYFASN